MFLGPETSTFELAAMAYLLAVLQIGVHGRISETNHVAERCLANLV